MNEKKYEKQELILKHIGIGNHALRVSCHIHLWGKIKYNNSRIQNTNHIFKRGNPQIK
jgi:hypothetical protein